MILSVTDTGIGIEPKKLEKIFLPFTQADGKYQFAYGTWEAVGGSGDPAAAPEAEQDYRAALLYAQAGSSPWPVCG